MNINQHWINKYFEMLFPYKSLFVCDSNTLTAWWVAVTIIFFFLEWGLFYSFLHPIKKSLQITNEQAIQNNMLLKEQWKAYWSTFFCKEGLRKKTAESANLFFSAQILIDQKLNIRWWLGIPSILVGFGILGTFVGLTFGVSSFNTDSIEKIQGSIKVLLSGMSTAFASSVWGMALSIVFGWIEKILINSVSNQGQRFCEKLDEKFLLSKIDEKKWMLEDQEEILKKNFVFHNENNQEILPSFVLRDLRKESIEQTTALKSFSTDIADGIKISNETIAGFAESLSNGMSIVLKENFTHTVVDFKKAVDNLKEEKNESTGDFIEKIVSRLENVIASVSQQLLSTVTNATKIQIENLAEMLGNAGESIKQLPIVLNKVIQEFQESISVMQKSIAETSEKTIQETLDSAKVLNSIMNETSERINQGTNETIDKIAQSMLELTQKLDSCISSIEKMLSKADSTSQQFAETVESLQKNTIKMMAFQSNQIIDFKKNIEQSRNIYSEATSKVIEKMTEAMSNKIVLSTQMNDSTNLSKNTSTDSNISTNEFGLAFNDAIEKYEKELILQALYHAKGVKAKAAELLKMNRTTLVEKIKKLNLIEIFQ
ncbi:MAG: hypothetical protein HQK79_08740 [Desulfobacterales bacterium]|nr:hypothetical protein [Desulfobacterales bacterium]